MELKGALSNPRLQAELPRLTALQARLHDLASADPTTPRPPTPRIGAVVGAITQVLELTEGSMRARDIQAAADALLGAPVKRSSVKATLAARSSGPHPRFERVGYGRYRIA